MKRFVRVSDEGYKRIDTTRAIGELEFNIETKYKYGDACVCICMYIHISLLFQGVQK